MIHIDGPMAQVGRSSGERPGAGAGAVLGAVFGALGGTCAVPLSDVGLLFESAPATVLLSGIAAGALLGAMTGLFLGAAFRDTPGRLSR
jgi:hypothetical protein